MNIVNVNLYNNYNNSANLYVFNLIDRVILGLKCVKLSTFFLFWID